MQGSAAPVHARTVPQENAPIQAAITNMYTLTWASVKQLKKTYEMSRFHGLCTNTKRGPPDDYDSHML